MSEVLTLDDVDAAAEQVVKTLREGGLAVVPTDTVYAVIADAFQPVATRRVFGAKRRSREIPLPVMIRNPRQVAGLAAEVSEAADRLMAAYWPGPLTLVLPAADGLTWDLGESGEVVAIRMPAADFLLAIARDIGPLACTAANRRGEAPPVTVDEAKAQLAGSVNVYVDGGRQAGALSTIVDVSDGEHVEVLREGAVSEANVRLVAAGGTAWGERPEEEPEERPEEEPEEPPEEEPGEPPEKEQEEP